MGYCTQTDIEAEFKEIVFSGSSAVTTTELAEWIDQESAYIDGRVGLRYVVPVTATNALKVLKRICLFRVSQRVKNVIEVKAEVDQKRSEEKYIQNKVMTPNDDLDLIIKGLLLLEGASLKSTKTGFNSFNVDKGVKNVFDVRKQQW